MKKISAGHGEPRFTLYIPLVMHRLSHSIDLELLASELGKKLSVAESTIGKGKGWEQLRMGPFPTVEMANEAFHRTIRHLVTLCVQCQYPIFFDQELMKVVVPDVPVTFDFDDPIDAWANLVYPVIVPEHIHVYDSGVMLANVDPQMRPEQLIDALHGADDRPIPLPPRVRLAVDAYIAACATHSHMMKFVGFVICLEAFCEQESRTVSEITALKMISSAVKKSDISKVDDVHAQMVSVALNAIGKIQQTSIGAQFQKLIAAHATSIASHLEPGHPWGNDMKEAAKTIYGMRSKIVHEESWGAEYGTVYTAMNFARTAAKAVLLDKLSEPPAIIE